MTYDRDLLKLAMQAAIDAGLTLHNIDTNDSDEHNDRQLQFAQTYALVGILQLLLAQAVVGMTDAEREEIMRP